MCPYGESQSLVGVPCCAQSCRLKLGSNNQDGHSSVRGNDKADPRGSVCSVGWGVSIRESNFGKSTQAVFVSCNTGEPHDQHERAGGILQHAVASRPKRLRSSNLFQSNTKARSKATPGCRSTSKMERSTIAAFRRSRSFLAAGRGFVQTFV